MIRALVVEDEQTSRNLLNKMVQRYLSEKVSIVDSVDSVDSAIASINKNNPDLVFLDLKLNGQDGLDLLYHYKDNSFEVIITTAHDEYAIEAVRANAIDYIMKPINMVDLVSSIKRYEAKCLTDNSKNSNSKLNNYSQNKVAFPSKNGFVLEDVNNIVYCEARGNYSAIYLINKKEFLISKTLKKVVEMIQNPAFFRIHKSYYLNMNFVVSYNRSENLVELNNGKFLPVSVRKNEAFIKLILNK
jgi:two-component system, LytTR family, response regulator